ncbi:hypothetical protein HYW83_01720 [Candidatus Peregrinibacteria bacterium]|nr:hypothetical protein [Candidatus Peregrinibacteria bacterium]
MPSKPPAITKEFIAALGRPRKTLKTASGVGETAQVIGQGTAREVVDLLTKRSIPLTAEAREAVLHEMQTVNILVARVGSRQALQRSLTRLEASAHEAQIKFEESLQRAARHKKFFGEVPARVIQDLLLTFEVLLNSRRFVRTVRAQPQMSAPIGPARPAPVPPTSTGAPPPTSPGPVQPKTPEQEQREKELEELEEQLRRSKEQHKNQHQAFDPVMEQLKELMRKMGVETGLNDSAPPNPKGPQFPPEHRKEFSPSMDERNAVKEGEEAPEPWFTIEPPLRGYFRQTVFDSFNKENVTWREDNTERPYPTVSVPRQHTLRGSIGGKIALPLPAGYLIDYTSLEPADSIKMTYDEEHGVTYLESSKPQPFSVAFGRHNIASAGKVQAPAAYHSEDIITGDLCSETFAFLTSVSGLSPQARAKAIAEYVQEFLEYSNDSTFNFIYKSNPETYFQKIEEFKKVDCDVASTYFVGLCRRAGIPARLVVGHSVSGAKNGKAEIGSGTPHAWAEIWDGTAWQTIDPQPPAPQDEEGAGEALDTSCREEKTDLQQKQPKPKPNPHKKAKEQEKKLREAKEKNAQQALEQGEMDQLKGEQEKLEGQQKQEIQQSVKENVDLMKDEADALEKAGRKEDADALRDKLKPVEDALRELTTKPVDPQAREALKTALEEANKQAVERGFQEFHRIQLRLMQQRVEVLMREEEEHK